MTKNITKIKEKLNILKENTYNLSDFNTISGKPFEVILRDNIGVPFDTNEKRKFIEKQDNFGGIDGKVEFIRKKSTNEISAQIFSNGSTKIYVFKKLPNKKHKGMYNYACFVYIKPPTQTSDASDNDTEGDNSDAGMDLFQENEYKYLDLIFEADNNVENNNSDTSKQNPDDNIENNSNQNNNDNIIFTQISI